MVAEFAEKQVMAHRYLYYVLATPVLSDAVYDQIEREARQICDPESPVHNLGSSLPSSYTSEQVSYAYELLRRGI